MDSIKCSRAEDDRERAGRPWYNLLIVDDEPLILESLYHMLVKRYGRKFLIYQAASADEALEQFKSIRVDLLMTISVCLVWTGFLLSGSWKRNGRTVLRYFLQGTVNLNMQDRP